MRANPSRSSSETWNESREMSATQSFSQWATAKTPTAACSTVSAP